MKYEEIELLKQSEKSSVHLVRKEDGDQVFIQKILKGQHHIYSVLQNYQHPYLPRIYEVILSDESTTVIEEYIEGSSLGSAKLSEKQLVNAVKELCFVLEFLHEKDIIHRDIKPSNIIFAKDGHIRLIDFDAARMMKADLEQDTRLLGTRGYAPPEQYGFSQTDERADIYALGITLKTLLGDKARKPRYHRIIQKCTNLDPDNRYRSAKQVRNAFNHEKRCILYGFAVILFIVVIYAGGKILYQPAGGETALTVSDSGKASESAELVTLPAPDNPHWNAETGIAVWGNVPESGDGGGEVGYHYRLYRRDTATPPDLEKDEWDMESSMRGDAMIDEATSTYAVNLSSDLWEDGYYYFAVSADGDGINYASSPYVISDAFEYKGEFAPMLPEPTGLAWKMFETDRGREYYATWSNLDDYEDADSFYISVYDKDGNCVMNNIWTKEYIMSVGHNGIRVQKEYLSDLDNQYRFTVEVFTSRPNEYKSFLIPEPVTEEYFSPWYNW